MEKKYKYRAVCHTKCYWMETLWKPGEIYEGAIKPGKHFSEDGKPPEDLPSETAGDDPRSNKELREFLEKHGVSAHPHLKRKELWMRVREIEDASGRDAVVVPDTGVRRIETPKPKVRKAGRKKKDS